MSVMRTMSSGACGRPSGRPTNSVPMAAPRERSGTARPSVGAAMRTGARALAGQARAQPAGEHGAQLARRAGPGLRVERRPQLGELVLVGVGESGEAQRAPPSTRCTAHQRPSRGTTTCGTTATASSTVQRLAQQLAGLGEVRHPGAAALVDGPQPARLDGHGDAVGDQLDEVAAVVRSPSRSLGGPSSRTDPRSGGVTGSAHVEDDRSTLGAGARHLGRPSAVALVDDHGHGVHVEHVAQAPDELLDQLQWLQPVHETRRDVQQAARLLAG